MTMLFARRHQRRFSTGIALVISCFLSTMQDAVAAPGARYSHEVWQQTERAAREPASASMPVTVILETDPGSAIAPLIASHQGSLRHRWNRLQEVSVPAGRLASLIGSLPESVLVRMPYPHEPAAVTGQGVELTGAADMHAVGQAGAGMTIGIIDLSFSNYASSQASGDLPSGLVITDYTGSGLGGGSHGTYVAEIVHEMAPGAALRLAKIGSEVQLSQALDDMIAAGTDVIVHSVAWFNAAFYDGTGPLCDIAGRAETAGVQWVNAAGNFRSTHYLGALMDADGDLRHEFAAGQDYNTISLTAGSAVSLYLNWDAYPTTTIDYDLYLYNGNPDSGGLVVAASENRQSGKGASRYPYPEESIQGFVPAVTGTYYIVVRKVTGSTANVRFSLFSLGPALGVKTTASSLAQPADCAGVLATGATNLSDVAEGFSSEGPTTDGRAKPEIAAPNRVQTSLTTSFSGTSAAAPHVGGAVALLRARNPGLSLLQIRWLLTSTARDVDAAGYDYRTGAGRVSLDADGDGYNHDADNCPLVSNASQADLDGDGLGDACDNDRDGDGLTNAQETVYGTHPANPDTDGDGLPDGNEVTVHNTDPLRADTDGDGLTDGEEVNIYGTDPNVSNRGDLAPRGAPDGVVDMADYLIMRRIVLGEIQPTAQELAQGDLYPAGAPDGVIGLPDLIVFEGRLP